MSEHNLSEDTEVVLLLCGRFGGEKQEAFQPLSTREYGELAKWLNARNLRPSDLLTGPGREALPGLHEARLERQRVEFLLGRGTAMALALERWARGGLWVMSRGDAEFPKRLKRRLKHAAPPLLYGAGNRALLESGGLAIIGSREASSATEEYTRAVAARCAKVGVTVVSGGARGVDASAMEGAMDANGGCIGVLAGDLLKACVKRQNRVAIQGGHLVLVSPYFPEAGFIPGNAMGRNKYIYTLADNALVIDSALGGGGTWAGAVENLKHRWVPLYVRTPGEKPGNAALVADGAIPFTLTMETKASLVELFTTRATDAKPCDIDGTEAQTSLLTPETESLEEAAAVRPPSAPEQWASSMATVLEVASPTQPSEAGAKLAEPSVEVDAGIPTQVLALAEGDGAVVAEQEESQATGGRPLDMYNDFVVKLTALLGEAPLPEDDIASRLGLEKVQAKAWLKRASEAGTVEKLKKPVRFSLVAKQLF